MQNPIKATYSETPDYFAQMSDEIPLRPMSVFEFFFMTIVGPAVLGWQTYAEGEKYWIIWQILICLIFWGMTLLYLLYLRRLISRWKIKKLFADTTRTQPIIVEWIFSDADVIQRAGSESSSRFAWDYFKKSIQSPRGFLLETPDKLFHWIPREALTSNESFEALAQLLKQKIERYEVTKK